MEIKCIETGINETTEWGAFRIPDPSFPNVFDKIKIEGCFEVGGKYELTVTKIKKEMI